MMGYAIWTLNYFLVWNELEEQLVMKSWSPAEKLFVSAQQNKLETVFNPILITCFILDLFIVVKITENYKILCSGSILCCLDKEDEKKLALAKLE